MANESELDILIRILLDKGAEDELLDGLRNLTKGMKDFEDRIAGMKAKAREMRGIARDIGQISREAFAIGTVITGGIFAAAAKYVKDAKVATEITERWKAAQDSLGRSGNRVGAVLAQQALPLLETAARLAVKAADFVEKHPEIVRAALNTGLVLAGLGAVGLAVSKGIKLYADVLYLAAVAKEALGMKEFSFAVNKFVLGVAQMNGVKIGGGAAAGAGGLLASIGEIVAGTILPILGGGFIGDKIGDAIAKKMDPSAKNYGIGDYLTAVRQSMALNVYSLDKLIRGQDQAHKDWLAITQFFGFNKSSDTTVTAQSPTGVAASENFDQILKAYEDYKNDDLKMVQDHYAERKQITNASLNAEKTSNDRYSASVSRINTQRSSELAQAARQFADAQAQAETQYQEQRAQTIRDGNIQIQDLAQKHQEELRKMAQEHADRMDGFARSRDALGLVKEQRDYKQQVTESNKNSREEIQQRRRDIAIRLADMAKAYEQERAQRAADYAARVQEINAQASQQLSELRLQHDQELREIRRARIDKLKELDSQFLDERKRRTQQFVATIRDLDSALLGEKNLRNQYQKQMTADLDAWLKSYRDKLAALAPSPTGRAAGGYASYGTYLLGDAPGGGRGRPEYVMSGNTTQAMERALGGALTQDKIVQLAALLGGGHAPQITYQDSRRISSQVSVQDRNRMTEDTMGALQEIVNNAIPR